MTRMSTIFREVGFFLTTTIFREVWFFLHIQLFLQKFGSSCHSTIFIEVWFFFVWRPPPGQPSREFPTPSTLQNNTLMSGSKCRACCGMLKHSGAVLENLATILTNVSCGLLVLLQVPLVSLTRTIPMKFFLANFTGPNGLDMPSKGSRICGLKITTY